MSLSYELTIGLPTNKLYREAKQMIGFSSDSVTIAELCIFYLKHIEDIEKEEPKKTQLKAINTSTEPFSKWEIVFLLNDRQLKRGKITGFSTKGKIHIALDDGAILEHQNPSDVFHEWDVGYTPLQSPLSTETPK